MTVKNIAERLFYLSFVVIVASIIPMLYLAFATKATPTAAPDNSRYDSLGWVYVHKFGENHDIDTGTVPEDVWSAGGVYPFPTTAGVITVTSSSDEDKLGGLGAITVTVEGLDNDLMIQSESIAITGTGTVTLVNQYKRLHRAYVIGSNSVITTNVGDIKFYHTGNLITQIDATEGQTAMAIYTIPKDYDKGELCSAVINTARFTGAANTVIQGDLFYRPEGAAWRNLDNYTAKSGVASIPIDYGDCIDLEPGADIKWVVEDTTADNTDVIATFDIRLKNN